MCMCTLVNSLVLPYEVDLNEARRKKLKQYLIKYAYNMIYKNYKTNLKDSR